MTGPLKRILVAEDNIALRGVIRFNLEQAGFSVAAVSNGSQALEALAEGPFDLVVTDHQMPGCTGEQVCRWMRRHQRCASTPVIMLTAKGLELDVPALIRELGIAHVISKPFSPSEVVALVEDCLAVGVSKGEEDGTSCQT